MYMLAGVSGRGCADFADEDGEEDMAAMRAGARQGHAGVLRGSVYSMALSLWRGYAAFIRCRRMWI